MAAPPEKLRVQPERKAPKKKAKPILGVIIKNWPGRLTKHPINSGENLRGTVLRAEVVERTKKGRYVVRVYGAAPTNGGGFKDYDDLQSTGKSYTGSQIKGFMKMTLNQAAE